MVLFANEFLASIFAGAAIVILTVTLLLRIYRYQARQKKPSPRPLPRRESPADESARWEVQMHELARDLSGQLDSKMAALGHLIREADRATANLEAALDRSGDSSPAEQPSAESSRHGPAQEADQRDTSEEVHTLADYGFSPHEIASRLDMPLGEVERLLSRRAGR